MERDFLELLGRLIALRSISAEPTCAPILAETAEVLRQFLIGCGFSASLHENYGPGPILTAECGPRDAPLSVLLYGHYDVQPPEPMDLWRAEPFALQEFDGTFYGRGIADDKGPMLLMLWELCKMRPNSSPVRTVVLLEGGEEVGSPGFADFLRAQRSQLAANATLIVDSGCPDNGIPALTTGLRGIISFEIHLRTGERELHSGFGGCIPNAVQELVKLCGRLHEESGRVAVPNFYENVAMPSGEELAAFRSEQERDPIPQKAFAVTYLRNIFPPLLPRSVHALLPSLEFHGISGGYQGPGNKNIIPAEASAKFSIRLVPNQDPEFVRDAVEKFLRKNVPPHVSEMSVHASTPSQSYAIDWTSASPAYITLFRAMEVSLQESFSAKPLHLREGGSIGVVGAFKEILGIDSILVGVVPPSSNIHGPNENWQIDTMKKAQRALASFREIF
ncbi:MAG: M20/M25/M40 family metallo-hydrolase [Puniceicoccales bacterium]|jgi:acetylornithine deacetylase/succinyl-diaminopimelate desuccinylase-like protein|nr:M20/M25/M40 family metallo-hydrolase [Puniceicoccales bacterium]